MKILALIPARGGSKRLPQKNVRLLGGKPLITWSIEVIAGISEICDVLVSTDDPQIELISKLAGARVPWKRPPELATDTASSVAVALHGVNWYEEHYGPLDGLLLLQPTSPFRSANTVRRGIELYKESGFSPVIAVSPADSHPAWTFKIEGDSLIPYVDSTGHLSRSQDLPLAYVVNGSFYLIHPRTLRETNSLFGRHPTPLIITSKKESLDVDTPYDFILAEHLLSYSET